MLRRWLLALLLLALAPLAGAEEKDELETATKALERLRSRESKVLAELEAAEREARLAAESEKLSRSEEAAAKGALAEAKAGELEAAGRLSQQLSALGPRLLARYRLERRGLGAVLLGAPDAAAQLRARAGLQKVLAADREALARTRALGEELAARRRALEPLQAAVQERTAEATAARAAAKAKAAERRGLLAGVRGERTLHERLVAELSQEERRLEGAVTALPRSAGKGGLAAKKGKLPWPVTGATLEQAYGRLVEPKFKTVTLQKGWDLRAHEGAEVHAIAAGTVAHAGWFGAYGNLLILDHGDGFHSLYAHLSGVAKSVGDVVEAGELVALVGDTGSLKGPYLYFELRKGGTPQNPKDWLRPR